MHLFSKRFSNSGQNFKTRSAQQCVKHDLLVFCSRISSIELYSAKLHPNYEPIWVYSPVQVHAIARAYVGGVAGGIRTCGPTTHIWAKCDGPIMFSSFMSLHLDCTCLFVMSLIAFCQLFRLLFCNCLNSSDVHKSLVPYLNVKHI